MREEIMKTMKFHEGFKKNLYNRITRNLEKIATEANDKRENLEKRLKNHPRRPCTFPTDWHWRNSVVLPSISKLQKMAIHNEINDTENTCKTFQYVFLAFKQWIETFTKNCRNSKIIGQQQVRKLNKERNKVFQNFAIPVCTGYC